MATLNRALLTSTPTFAEDYVTVPQCWTEHPRSGRKFRMKYDHSGDTPLARGLGMNGETQIYANQSYLGGAVGNPLGFASGVMTINATPATAAAKTAVEASVPANYAYPKTPKFRSAMFSTEGFFYQQYGYFEFRTKEDPCVGSFSAGWLSNPVGGRHQEIDVFERLGGDPNNILCTAHSDLDQWGGVRATPFAQSLPLAADQADVWSTKGVLWTRDTISWYREDVLIGSMANPGIHHPLFMIVDLAMDGNWNAQQGYVADPAASASMDIDFIKAWQLL